MQISSLGRGVLQRGSSRGLVCRPLHAGHAAEAHPPKKSAVAVSAAPSKQEPGSNTTSSMPRLPPRKGAQPPANPTPSAEQGAPRPKSSSSSSSRSRLKRLGSFAGGPNQPPPSEPPHSAMQEKALAGLLAYTGLMGTIATAVAFCTPGVDLFGGFHWDAADVSLALKLMLPVYGLNLLIMLPNYSSWKLPEVTAESQAAMVEAIAKWSAKKRSKGSSRGSSRGSSSAGVSMADGSAEQRASAAAGDAAAAGSVVPAAEGEAACHAAAAAAAAPGTTQQPPVHTEDKAPMSAAAVDAAPASSGSSSSSSSSSMVAPEASTLASTGMPTSRIDVLGSGSSSSEAEDSWFDKQLKSPGIMRMRDALYMAQGHYLSLNPAVVLPLPLQAPVLLADCLAAELLYRSVALQLGGSWIWDRMVEAGVDDFYERLLAGLPVLPTHAAGQLVAVALLSAASGLLVLRSMQRMARRPQLVLGAQGRQAAGQLLTDLQDRHRQQQRQQQQQQEDPRNNSDASSSSSPSDQQPQQHSASRAAADWAVASAKASASASQQQQQQQQQGGPQPEPRWSRVIPSTLSGLALSQLVQGTRDIGQMTALGLSFVLTGNLAAPFAAAVVNQALMAALQRRGLERARQRSIAMAKHLAGITRQLRDAQRKQEEKKRQQQLQGEQQQLAVTAGAGQDAKPAATAAEGASSSSSASANTTAAAAGAQDALASFTQAYEGAAAASPTQDSPAVLAAAAATAHGTGAEPAATAAPVQAAPAGEALAASRMERTINVLDQLLGQLGEHATAGPGPGK